MTDHPGTTVQGTLLKITGSYKNPATSEETILPRTVEGLGKNSSANYTDNKVIHKKVSQSRQKLNCIRKKQRILVFSQCYMCGQENSKC